MNDDYYIGLDIGTSSVGWAATDTSYTLCRAKHKTLWGSRLFEEANKAAETRAFRTARRRLQRRNARLNWLREEFREELEKVDPYFLTRLQESKFLEEDKKLPINARTKNLIANDPGFSDKDFFKRYPTAYHLRYELMTSKSPHDVRLVYLAVHHILKSRGHFLISGSSENFSSAASSNLEETWIELSNYIESRFEEEGFYSRRENIEEVMRNADLSIKDKASEIKKLFPSGSNSSQIAQLLIGKSIRVKDIFDNLESADSIDFKGSFEDKADALLALLGEDFVLIELCKKIYDADVLSKILSSHSSISEAKISDYNKHKSDLKKLKTLIRSKFSKEVYKEIFNAADKVDNYAAYSGQTDKNYRCSYEDFKQFLKKKIKSSEDEIAQKIIEELDRDTFLPLIRTTDNSAVPHQLHEAELRLILENAASYLPMLNKEEDGIPLKERILQTFRFRIDYFVGPLNPKSKRAWLVRNSNEKITPWNYEQVVDKAASAERFINRMTKKCTYLGCEVLPKESLLFKKYLVLNTINRLCVDYSLLLRSDKQAMYEHFALTGEKLTLKNIRRYLVKNGLCEPDVVISGIDPEISLDLSIFKKIRNILGPSYDAHVAEKLIKYSTILPDSPEMMRSILKREFGDLMRDDQIDAAIKLKLSGWSSLSKEFLTDVRFKGRSIIDVLWDGNGVDNSDDNSNLMQIINRKGFVDAIENYKKTHLLDNEFSVQRHLEESYAAPGIKRAINQSLKIVEELIKAKGGMLPKRIFIETTRTVGEKRRTISRFNRLSTLYKSLDKEYSAVKKELEEQSDTSLSKDKLYLYFTQLGKCMYSGERIDINSLGTDYDIDHIMPYSKTGMDELDNKVLVKKELNTAKKDVYPLSQSVRSQQTKFWEILKNRNLISEEKFSRLTRRTPLTNTELSGFIKRQIVETSQASKLVAEIIKLKYQEKIEVVHVKARAVSHFRAAQTIGSTTSGRYSKVQDPLFTKVRCLNDMHHAKDAYLNIIVGNLWRTKFTDNFEKYVEENPDHSFNKLWNEDVPGAWSTYQSPKIVRSQMKRNDVIVTRYIRKETGKLFDSNPLSAKNKESSAERSQLKTDPRFKPEKYGYYNSIKSAYNCVVEWTDSKNKRTRALKPVLLQYLSLYESDPQKYCVDILGLTDPKIIVKCLKKDSILEINGYRCILKGRSNDQFSIRPGIQIILNPERSKYLKTIAKNPDESDAQQNLAMWKDLERKVSSDIYCGMYSKIADLMRKSVSENKFQNLNLTEQVELISGVIALLSAKAPSVNLKSIGGVPQAGKKIVRIKLDNPTEPVYLIAQSVCGLFENRIKLSV